MPTATLVACRYLTSSSISLPLRRSLFDYSMIRTSMPVRHIWSSSSSLGHILFPGQPWRTISTGSLVLNRHQANPYRPVPHGLMWSGSTVSLGWDRTMCRANYPPLSFTASHISLSLSLSLSLSVCKTYARVVGGPGRQREWWSASGAARLGPCEWRPARAGVKTSSRGAEVQSWTTASGRSGGLHAAATVGRGAAWVQWHARGVLRRHGRYIEGTRRRVGGASIAEEYSCGFSHDSGVMIISLWFYFGVMFLCDLLYQIDVVTYESYTNDLIESNWRCNLMIFIVESTCVSLVWTIEE
jgi:hypothetical protein